MAANTAPIFKAIAHLAIATVDTANSNRNGTGAITTVTTGDTDGTIIEEIEVQATETVAQGMIRFFLRASSGGTYTLWREVSVPANTPSATVPAWYRRFLPSLGGSAKVTDSPGDGLPLLLPAGYQLGASTSQSKTFRIYARGGDYS